MLNENAKRGNTIFRICHSIDRIPFVTFHTTWREFSFKNLCIAYSLYILTNINIKKIK